MIFGIYFKKSSVLEGKIEKSSPLKPLPTYCIFLLLCLLFLYSKSDSELIQEEWGTKQKELKVLTQNRHYDFTDVMIHVGELVWLEYYYKRTDKREDM